MSERDEFIKGPNVLRLAQIEQSLQRIKDAGFEREAELLRSEIEVLRQKAGAVYDSVEPVFSDNVKRRNQPRNAAMERHRSLEEYKEELRKWALDKYEQDKQWRLENDKFLLPKKAGNKNAAKWLLGLYDDDRGFEKESKGEPLDPEGNHNGSPQVPAGRTFEPSINFFYEAIKKKS
ncbi:hypothetical protein V6D52_06255 [Idiomarina loihiensis]|uniref:hypothetical protein n=1 Tax=Idiomarina loihiensis TaxID=135577 RepID=UPI0039BE69D2